MIYFVLLKLKITSPFSSPNKSKYSQESFFWTLSPFPDISRGDGGGGEPACRSAQMDNGKRWQEERMRDDGRGEREENGLDVRLQMSASPPARHKQDGPRSRSSAFIFDWLHFLLLRILSMAVQSISPPIVAFHSILEWLP